MPIVRKIALTVAALVAASACAAPTTEAAPKAAPRPVYSGTVGIVYGQGVNYGYGAGRFDTTRWNVPAAVAAANASGALGKVKVVQIKTQKECWQLIEPSYCVMISTAPDAYASGNPRPGQPTAVTLVIDRGLPLRYQLLESQVSLSDKVGAKATAAQRQAWLVAALKTAIPR